MSPNDSSKCGSCAWYEFKTQRCKCNPPVPVDNRHSRFPITHWDDWCGQWKEKS